MVHLFCLRPDGAVRR